MYLARERINNQVRYFIRQSFKKDGHLKSRTLYDLGTDPAQFIIYPGGNSYYYETSIIDTLASKGIDADQSALDPIFFEFLHPEIQRVITGFDRRYQGNSRRTRPPADLSAPPPHLFDKKRYHFLRFGARLCRQIHHLPEKVFRPLLNKSRDELEQYFLKEEQILKPHEIPVYVATIFQLKRFMSDPKSKHNALSQLDQLFMRKLCQLDSDKQFWAGTPKVQNLHHYLTKYAIMYFDFDIACNAGWQLYVQDFINRHRAYRPPPKVRAKMAEAEKLFGLSWKDLKQLNRAALSRRYRRLALKHHPDQGGDPDLFNRLTQYYKALLRRKV